MSYIQDLCRVLLSTFTVSGCTQVLDAGELDSRSCARDHKVCADETGRLTCVPNTQPEYGCASASCSPCYFQNATGSECVDGLCSPTSCRSGFLKGPGESENCSVDVHHDVNNCGNLGSRCRSGEMCVAGHCVGAYPKDAQAGDSKAGDAHASDAGDMSD